MTGNDMPFPTVPTPAQKRIMAVNNNKLGALSFALYSYWREVQVKLSGNKQNSFRRNAYSIIIFDESPHLLMENVQTMDTDTFLDMMLKFTLRGENWVPAFDLAKSLIEKHCDPLR